MTVCLPIYGCPARAVRIFGHNRQAVNRHAWCNDPACLHEPRT